MTAAVNLLRQLRAAEIDVTADADRLRLRSRTPLPPGLIERPVIGSVTAEGTAVTVVHQ